MSTPSFSSRLYATGSAMKRLLQSPSGMGHRHDKDEILRAALDAALDEGLSQLTFGRLASRLGINDRTVVYYFPTKHDLVTEVVTALGERLQQALAEAFSVPADDHCALARAAWPVLANEDNDPIFAVFFEATGLATAGREPYRSLVSELVAGWIDWTAAHVSGPPERQRAEAEATVALIDGLLLLRQLAGPAAADRAAARLDIASG